MNNDLFMERNSANKTGVNTGGVSTRGRGCLSVIATAPVFGLIVCVATYALGYGTATAVYAGLATMGVIFGLYLLTTLAMLGLFAAVAAFGVLMALWFGVTRR